MGNGTPFYNQMENINKLMEKMRKADKRSDELNSLDDKPNIDEKTAKQRYIAQLKGRRI